MTVPAPSGVLCAEIMIVVTSIEISGSCVACFQWEAIEGAGSIEAQEAAFRRHWSLKEVRGFRV